MIDIKPQDIDGIDAGMHEAAREYLGVVGEILGADLTGLTFFGRVVAGSFDPVRHTAASVVVLSRVDLESLRRLGEQGERLGRLRLSAPLIMTPDYIRASLDSFPLELLEIQLMHATVFGEDHFADLPLGERDVRLECERELKRMLIQMRQGLLVAGSMDFMLADLQHGVGDELVRTLRGYLWLSGMREALPGAKVVEVAEQTAGLKLAGLRSALDGHTDPGWEEFRSLYADIDALANCVDRFDGKVRA